MAQKVRCPNCGALLQVRESLIGKRGRCAACASIIELKPEHPGTYQIQTEPGPAAAPAQEPGLQPAEPSGGPECARCHTPLSRFMDVCPHCGVAQQWKLYRYTGCLRLSGRFGQRRPAGHNPSCRPGNRHRDDVDVRGHFVLHLDACASTSCHTRRLRHRRRNGPGDGHPGRLHPMVPEQPA